MSELLTLDTGRHKSRVLTSFLAERGGFERAGLEAPAVQASANGAVPIGTGSLGQPLVDMLGAQPANSGARVNELTAMKVSTVYACTGLIAGALASLPKKIYERVGNDSFEVSHDYWWLLNERSCGDFSAAVYWEYMATALLLQGDAFAQILRPSIGSSRVIGLRPLHPQRVWVRRTVDDTLYYVVQPINGTAAYILDAADILHIPGLGFDGWRGMSVVRYAAKEAIGLGLATEEFSSRFFGNGARPDFVFKTEKALNQQQREALLETWRGQYQGVANSHMPAILTGGLELEKISMSPEDAALLDARGFQVEDICRFFGVPPFMVGHTDTNTTWGSGMEAMGAAFVRYTLQRHLVKFEQEMNGKFWPIRSRYYTEIDAEGLERGNIQARFTSYRMALGRAGEPGFMKINEVRRKEKLPPVPDGDKLNPGTGSPAKQPADGGGDNPDEGGANASKTDPASA